MEWFLLFFSAALAALFTTLVLGFLFRRAVVNWAVDRALIRLLKDPYRENLWDLVVGIIRVPPQILLELELRAESGEALERPLGTVRQLPGLAGVAFSPAQIVRQPLDPLADIDLTTELGPRCRRPLQLSMPIMLGALPYGVALSKQFCLALAFGAGAAGTAYNAGSGPVLPEVIKAAKILVLQYGGGAWNRDPDILAQADMIEIRYGHGSRAGIGQIFPPYKLPPELPQLLGLNHGEAAMNETPLPGAATPRELRQLVPELRRLVRGRPIGVKLAASQELERELAIVLEAGIDVIALDGAEGGTHAAPPVLADDFGLPTAHALCRAVNYLETTGARKEVSLIIGGGLRTPGEYLKALALGADAIFIGTVAIMACTHMQLSKAVPFEPITSIAWAMGARADRFNVEQGAAGVTNYLRSSALELREALRALGKPHLHQINRQDLIARDRETAATFGLPSSWAAPKRDFPPHHQ